MITDDAGNQVSSVKYLPYGETRVSTGTLDTDKLFTGQRLDDTGLYYYNARYYDPNIGRFISADTIVPNPMHPQALNRYSYCVNNPLLYIDPSGHGFLDGLKSIGNAIWDAGEAVGGAIADTGKAIADTTVNAIEWVGDNASTVAHTALDVAGFVPVIGEAADAVNGVIYLVEGDKVNAGLSFAACIPVVGSAATGGKYVKKIVSAVDKIDDLSGSTKFINKNGEDILVLGRGPKERLERLATKEGGHISSTSSNSPRDIFKKNYSDIRKADRIIQYMDNIPTTLDEALLIGGQYSRAEVYMINQRKDLLLKTIRKFEF